LLYDRNLQIKTNNKQRKVTYEVLNDRNKTNLKTRKSKLTNLAYLHLTHYDVINTKFSIRLRKLDLRGF